MSLRRALLFLLLAAGFGSTGAVRAADREVVLVVSAESSVLQLDAIEIQKLFLGFPVLRENRTLHPVRNLSDDRLSDVFLQHIVAMSQSAYDRRILTQVLQQGRPRPAEVKTPAQVIQTLASDPFAVSYMWLRDVPATPRMRILRVLWAE